MTVTRWAKSGTLPSIKVGRDYRFRSEDVARLLEPKVGGES